MWSVELESIFYGFACFVTRTLAAEHAWLPKRGVSPETG
jgi:hypothetical protein